MWTNGRAYWLARRLFFIKFDQVISCRFMNDCPVEACILYRETDIIMNFYIISFLVCKIFQEYDTLLPPSLY
jgi:hypothetical protein